MSDDTPRDPTKQQASSTVITTKREVPTDEGSIEVQEEWKSVTDKRTPNIFKPAWLEENVAKMARVSGFIELAWLPRIFAVDEQYNDDLPGLWKTYQCYIRKSAEPDVSTPMARFSAWDTLFERWAFGTVAAVSDGLKQIARLPFTFQPVEDKCELYNKEAKPEVAFVKLDDLKDFLTTKIIPKIPLPEPLFPDNAQIEKLIEHDSPELAKHENVFLRHGGVWHVKYKGKATTIKHLKGLAFIAFLLDNADKEFDPRTLNSLVESPLLNNNEISGRLEQEDLVMDEIWPEDMTKTDEDELKYRVSKLWEKSKSKSEKDVINWEQAKTYLEKQYNIIPYGAEGRLRFKKGRSKLRGDIDQLRKNIQKVIARARKEIEEKIPHAVEFLRDIVTGNVFSYKPASKTDWYIQR